MQEDYANQSEGPSSPCDDMDITLPITNRQPTVMSLDGDDITAGVPSLTALLAEDEAPEATPHHNEDGNPNCDDNDDEQRHTRNDDAWDITTAVPGLGAILEEDERGEGPQHPDPQPCQTDADLETLPLQTLTANQKDHSNNAPADSKWGFEPGGDDTLDLDLAGHGKMFMGDATYNRMYLADPTMTAHNPQPSSNPKATPDWGAPAFVPPFQPSPLLAHAQAAKDHHPALYESPALTTSSLNTSISTRRVSMGSVQPAAWTKRRASLAGDALAASLLGGTLQASEEEQQQQQQQQHEGDAEEQHTDELLADDLNEMNEFNDFNFQTVSSNPPVNEAVTSPHGFENTTNPRDPQSQGKEPYTSEKFNGQEDTTAHVQLVQHHVGMVDQSRMPFTDPKTAYSTVFGNKYPENEIENETDTETKTERQHYQQKGTTAVKDTPTPSHDGPGLGSRRRSEGYQGPPPGSAIAARYPGSAVATGRLSQGFTPSNLPPITFQDFTKLIEVQFLDNLRRGASINYADLAPNPLPKGIVDAYTLMCITAPNVKELEVAISTLQSETARLRRSAADLELMLGQANPPIFRHVQTASMEQLDAFRANFGMLKKVCRAKALVLLKDVRCQMEASKARRLDNAAAFLAGEMARIKEAAGHADSIANAAHEFAQTVASSLREREAERKEEGARRLRVAALLAGLADARAGNAARRERKRELQERLEKIKASRAEVLARLTDLQARHRTVREDVAKAAEEEEVARARGEEAKRKEQEAEALKSMTRRQAYDEYGEEEFGFGGTDSVNTEVMCSDLVARFKMLDRLERCTGIKLVSTASLYATDNNDDDHSRRRVCRLRVLDTPYEADITAATVMHQSGESNVTQVSMTAVMSGATSPQDHQSYNGSNSSNSSNGLIFRAQVADGKLVVSNVISTMLMAAVPRLRAMTRVAAELQGVRLACPNLCELHLLPSSSDLSMAHVAEASMTQQGITLLFSDPNSGRRFKTRLIQSTLSNDGHRKLKCRAKDVEVWFCGDEEETLKRRQEVEAVVEGATGLRDACIALSRLAEAF